MTRLPTLHAALTLLLIALAPLGCDDDASGGADDGCVYNSDCPPDQICARGQCMDECVADRDCVQGQRCVDGACLADEDPANNDDDDSGDGGLDAPGDSGDGDAGGEGDAGEADAAPDVPRPEGFGSITGQVHFRLHDNTALPVAEPVVYWTLPNEAPEPLPDAASCECAFPRSAVTGNVDGTFTLQNVPAGPVVLVVQKGYFRRARTVEVPADATLSAPRPATELPTRTDLEAGDQVPSIVVGTGRFDAIEDVFAKLRMGPISSTWHFDYEAWMQDPGAWGVDLMRYQTPRELDNEDMELMAPDFTELLAGNAAVDLLDYQFVFAPCGEYDTYGQLLTSAQVRDTIDTFVYEGGKLYVTDYSYDVVEQVFPSYVDFGTPGGGDRNADGNIGDRDYMGIAAMDTLMYESDNRARNDQLARWLAVVGASTSGRVQTSGNWVNLNAVGEGAQCCDANGDPVTVNTEVVMDGPNGFDPPFGDFGPEYDTWEEADANGALHPHTLRFPYGCGEVMYSTYHTVDHQEASANLAPQELVLLWLILEINECNPDPIKEP